MPQMIALGQPVLVNCVRCGRHAWHVSVMPGEQRLQCPRCDQRTIVEFYTQRCSDGTLFKMDVRGCFWT